METDDLIVLEWQIEELLERYANYSDWSIHDLSPYLGTSQIQAH